MNQELNKKFAKLIVECGVNLQENQGLVINANLESVELVREIVKAAYERKTSDVIINWQDLHITKTVLENAKAEQMYITDWQLARQHYLVDKNYARVSISSPNPGFMAGVDMSESLKAQRHNAPLTKFAMEHTMNNMVQWCVVAYPNKTWAKQVFPNDEEDVALEKLYKAILDASHVTETNDPVEDWNVINSNMTAINEKLNELNFVSLHFKNELGTDLHVGLVENHIWAGGGEFTSGGVYFNPNIPTEENFCMPHNKKINGVVYSTKPLEYDGDLIEDFYIKFVDGKAVEFDAKKGVESLKRLIEFDEGSSSLGEVAIVPYYSPISLSNILFYNTLFDENASCHLALGASYIGTNLKDYTKYSEEELKEHGCNMSHTHVDFMFGSKDMTIVGTKHDGSEVIIFKDGKYII
ncbi:MAG: aminopeptidase [Bacilli bacterium]|nr:aminopeptidase [Bacilli bacterium]